MDGLLARRLRCRFGIYPEFGFVLGFFGLVPLVFWTWMDKIVSLLLLHIELSHFLPYLIIDACVFIVVFSSLQEWDYYYGLLVRLE